MRTATVVADDVTDLIGIHRELYNRSLAKVMSMIITIHMKKKLELVLQSTSSDEEGGYFCSYVNVSNRHYA